MRARLLPIPLLAVVWLAALAGTAQAAPRPSTAPARFTVLTRPAAPLAREAANVWGGTYTTSTGEMVRVFASDAYAADVAFNQNRAETLARLPHGTELTRVTAYFLTYSEMQRTCGLRALACYSPRDETIITLGEDAPDGTPANSILAHEYGHHIANNRVNAPWEALSRGPKRWASYLGVCARTESGELHPDDPVNYDLDPAEGFAEAYRVFTEVRAGSEPAWWDIVDRLFFPDAGAQAAIEQDVLNPWNGATTAARASSFTARGARSRSFRVATPLDGTMRVTVRPAAREVLRLSVRTPGGTVLGRAAAGSKTMDTTVCGQRTVVVRVDRVRGAGAFRLAISRP